MMISDDNMGWVERIIEWRRMAMNDDEWLEWRISSHGVMADLFEAELRLGARGRTWPENVSRCKWLSRKSYKSYKS